MKQDVVLLRFQPVLERAAEQAVFIDAVDAHGEHGVAAAENVVLLASGKRAFIAVDQHRDMVPFEAERQAPEPAGAVIAAEVRDAADHKAVSRALRCRRIKDKDGFIKARIAGTEIRVKDRRIADRAAEVQPVFRHSVLQTVHIGVRRQAESARIRAGER